MATIPQASISERRLGVLPQVGSARPVDWAGALKGVPEAGIALIDAMGRNDRAQLALQMKKADRDARIALTAYDKWMRAGIDGTVVLDADGLPTHAADGFSSKDWRQMEREGKTAADYLKERETAWRDGEEFKSLDAAARERFERSARFMREDYARAAAEIHRRNFLAKDRFMREGEEAADNMRLVDAEPLDDESFNAVSSQIALRKTLRTLGPLVANPEIADRPGATFADVEFSRPLTDSEAESLKAGYDALMRSHAEHRQAANERRERIRAANARKAAEAAGRDFIRRELEMRDLPQELWADRYEQMGRDPHLRALDPSRAMRYMNAASSIREAEERARKAIERESSEEARRLAQETRDRREESLSDALIRLEMAEMEGVPPEDCSALRADIWRNYAEWYSAGEIGTKFARTFLSSLKTRMSSEAAQAIRDVYRDFGYTGELGQSGLPSEGARRKDEKDGMTYYAPSEKGRVADPARAVGARELHSLAVELDRALAALPPGADARVVMDKAVSRARTRWAKDAFDANRDMMVGALMEARREFGRWRIQREGGGDGDGDRGK